MAHSLMRDTCTHQLRDFAEHPDRDQMTRGMLHYMFDGLQSPVNTADIWLQLINSRTQFGYRVFRLALQRCGKLRGWQ